ncbi:FMR1 neighbor protein [Apus apus]|uniref:FMR1 neighbor protein n=1 Tax=Apus apus TaxID=8895 RepID=UPI0021F83794|nr:FMR1 neighbor protein [Apus apus]
MSHCDAVSTTERVRLNTTALHSSAVQGFLSSLWILCLHQVMLICTCLAWNCVVLILLCSINSSFASPTQHVLEKNEVACSMLNVKLKEMFESVVSFFRPVTCRHKDEHTLVPCSVGEDLNTTECLKNKCCTSKDRKKLKCYMPIKDDTLLTLRLLLLVAGGFLILGCLPICLQRSRCFNPLRKANKQVKQIVKKRAQSEGVYERLLN